MPSCTSTTKSELEQHPVLAGVVEVLWKNTQYNFESSKWSTWFSLHGAANAVYDYNEVLAAELIFLRKLWAGMCGFED